jgi:hypothetical protein
MAIKKVCKKYYNSLIKPAFIGGVAAIVTVMIMGGSQHVSFWGSDLQTRLYNQKGTINDKKDNQEDEETFIELENFKIGSIKDYKIGGVSEDGNVNTNYKVLVTVNPFKYDEDTVEMANDKLQCKEDGNILQWQNANSNWGCIKPLKTVFDSISDSVEVSSSGEMSCGKDKEFLFWNKGDQQWECGGIGKGVDVAVKDLVDVNITNTPSINDVLAWDGDNWTPAVANSSAPFISNSTALLASPLNATTMTITGFNFIDSSAVSIPGFDGIINNVNILSPEELEVTITPGSNETVYDIIISNNGILNTEWSGNGKNLLEVTASNNGSSQTRAAENCKEILDNGHSTGDGNYWINPDGGGTANAFQVYCDMTTDGGGWVRIEYSADLTHQAQFVGGDANRWLPADFTFNLTDAQINNIRAVATEGKQRYHGTCQGVIHYRYQAANYQYAFGFRFHQGHETVHNQQTYPSTNIVVSSDGCSANNGTMASTDFDINDIRVPIINVHSRDNSNTEPFGSPLTNNPAWLR